MHNRNGSNETAKDFKGAIKKVLNYNLTYLDFS